MWFSMIKKVSIKYIYLGMVMAANDVSLYP